jgi:hypothetical protein
VSSLANAFWLIVEGGMLLVVVRGLGTDIDIGGTWLSRFCFSSPGMILLASYVGVLIRKSTVMATRSILEKWDGSIFAKMAQKFWMKKIGSI